MPEIRTSRLVLRAMTLDDVDVYCAYRTDPEVCAWLTSAMPPTRDQVVARVEHLLRLGAPTAGQDYRFLVEADGVVVGDVSIGISRMNADELHTRAEHVYAAVLAEVTEPV